MIVPALQLSQVLRARARQAAPDTLSAADSVAAGDTVSFADALRENPVPSLSDFQQLLFTLRAELLDAALWMGLAGLLVKVALILLLAFVVVRVVDRVTERWTRRFEELPKVHPRRVRAFTISNLASSTTRYVVWPVALITVLSEFDINVGALLATAGIAGLAVGFGAQTLVKDVISGVFLLFDDSIHVGDLVRIGSDTGTVEHIGVRLIKIRRFDGELMMVPAGELRIFGNKSIGFVRLIVNVGLSYEQDVETILPVMKRVADAWAAEHRDILLEEEMQVQALTDLAESSVNARIVAMVTPGEQFPAERELRILLKREFDRLGIEIPFPRRTVYMREEADRPTRSVVDPEAVAPADGEGQGSD